MKKILILILSLMLLLPAGVLAADAPIPADPALVSVLMPGYTLLEGHVNREGNILRLLMTRPDGQLVFVGGVHDAELGWQMTESTPLPEGTVLGVENFVDSLGFSGWDGCYTVDVEPCADGTWGVSLIYPPGPDGLFCVGPNWIFEEAGMPLLVGDHPWRDITTIDWGTLPDSYEDALSKVDRSDWALVTNPDPADRLNLRVQPDRKSQSLGKYYSGAPVHILEISGEWARVDILGVQGWMMTEFLAIGDAMSNVEYAGPWLSTRDGGVVLHSAPNEEAAVKTGVEAGYGSMKIIGIVDEEWYHVWFYRDGCGGYFHASDLWEGNG